MNSPVQRCFGCQVIIFKVYSATAENRSAGICFVISFYSLRLCDMFDSFIKDMHESVLSGNQECHKWFINEKNAM